MEHSMTRVGTLDKYYVPCEYVDVERDGGEVIKKNQKEKEKERKRARKTTKQREESESAKATYLV